MRKINLEQKLAIKLGSISFDWLTWIKHTGDRLLFETQSPSQRLAPPSEFLTLDLLQGLRCCISITFQVKLLLLVQEAHFANHRFRIVHLKIQCAVNYWEAG